MIQNWQIQNRSHKNAEPIHGGGSSTEIAASSLRFQI